MDPTVNVANFLRDIKKNGYQRPKRIRNKINLQKELYEYFNNDPMFRVIYTGEDFNIIVQFNGKIYWYVENEEKIRYGVLLSFGSFEIPHNKVELLLVNVKNKIRLDCDIDQLSEPILLETYDDVYQKIKYLYQIISDYLLKRHNMKLLINKLYKEIPNHGLRLINLKK